VIVTPRLRGLPLAETDFDDLYALHRDERVLAAFGADPSTAEETREFLDQKLGHWREHGFGIWMFRDPGGAFVGRCGGFTRPETLPPDAVLEKLGFAFERTFVVDGKDSVLYRRSP
jgi:RimJ/RimL family protein N-acetyltransferase